MFNSAALFFGRRCSSQLEIPSLWLVDDEPDDVRRPLTSSRADRRSRRTSFESMQQHHHNFYQARRHQHRQNRTQTRFRHSLPASAIQPNIPRPLPLRENKDGEQCSEQTPSTILAMSPESPTVDMCENTELPILSALQQSRKHNNYYCRSDDRKENVERFSESPISSRFDMKLRYTHDSICSYLHSQLVWY